MARLRLIKDAYQEIVSTDPNSALTLFALRTLVTKGIIPSIRVGSRYLIPMDQLYKFLAGSADND